MAITIVNSEVEDKLTEIAHIQPTKTTKAGVCIGILDRALRDGIEAANAWLHDNGNNGNNVPCGASDPDHDG